MITQRNIISGMCGVEKNGFQFSNRDSYLMYLPHSHIYDRLIFHILTNSGSRIGFYSGDIMNIKEDLQNLKPTLFISVPRLFNRFFQIITQNFQEKTGLSKYFLDSSLSKKRNKYEKNGSLKNGIIQKIIFKNVKNSLGGKIRLMISGSAPLSGEVIKFLRIVFSCPIIEGYGLTETCGASFSTHPDDSSIEHIGGPMPGIEAKIREIPEMEYYCTEKIHTGELYVRGPSIFIGYFLGQEYTDISIDSDGWFSTGDIVSRDIESGKFKVIDRINNIIKLSQGEYVSLEKIELALLKSKFVHQVFVYGDPFQHYLVAIIVPCKKYIQNKWIKNNNCHSDWRQIIENSKLREDLYEDIKGLSLKNQLNRYELVNKIHLEPEEWTDQDLLTSTQKLIRNKAKIKYKEIIQNLYSE